MEEKICSPLEHARFSQRGESYFYCIYLNASLKKIVPECKLVCLFPFATSHST